MATALRQVVVSFVVLASTASAVRAERSPLDRHLQPAARPAVILDFTATAGCSPAPRITPSLTVAWRATRAALGRQRLEISAHKGGFETGLFATLDPISRGTSTRRSGSPNLPARFFRSALALTATDVNVDRSGGVVQVLLAGLQPGLNYFVRVATERGRGWAPGPTLRRAITPCITEDGPRRRAR